MPFATVAPPLTRQSLPFHKQLDHPAGSAVPSKSVERPGPRISAPSSMCSSLIDAPGDPAEKSATVVSFNAALGVVKLATGDVATLGAGKAASADVTA